jgi:hypothetical protein
VTPRWRERRTSSAVADDGPDTEAILKATWTALLCALRREEGRGGEEGSAVTFGDAIEKITLAGPAAIHLALCGWCGLTMHKLARAGGLGNETENFRAAGAFWFLQVEDVETGASASIDEIEHAAARDAIRVAVCFANNDHDTIAAIVETTWDAGPEAVVDLMLAAVQLAAKTTKALPEPGEAGDEAGGGG